MKRDDDSLDLLIQKLRWLRLPGMAQLVSSLLEQAKTDNLTDLDILHRLCDEERASRMKSAVDRRVKDAKFPELNTVDGFDFDFDPVRKKLRARYLALHDLTFRRSCKPTLVGALRGSPGRHAALATGSAGYESGPVEIVRACVASPSRLHTADQAFTHRCRKDTAPANVSVRGTAVASVPGSGPGSLSATRASRDAKSTSW